MATVHHSTDINQPARGRKTMWIVLAVIVAAAIIYWIAAAISRSDMNDTDRGAGMTTVETPAATPGAVTDTNPQDMTTIPRTETPQTNTPITGATVTDGAGAGTVTDGTTGATTNGTATGTPGTADTTTVPPSGG